MTKAAQSIVPILPRRQAFAAAGWSLNTGKLRELTDPSMPLRVIIGPNRYGFRADEWQRYLDSFARAPRAERRGAQLQGVSALAGADTPGNTPKAAA